ncbi:MAG TPA: hypothetical protein VFB25_11975 [Gaiellaceae bacterium]|nr:hypothetical protein [Gaiellaceae bacterium]
MWVLRELVRLVVRIAVAAIVAFAIAGILAAIGVHAFSHDARITCIAIGCMLLAMAGIGRGSNFERSMDVGVQQAAWGNIPGFDAIRAKPEDPRLHPGVAFFCSGLILIGTGVLI